MGPFPPFCGRGGSAWGGSPPPPLWHGVGSGFLAEVPPCAFGSALGVWYTHSYGDNDDDGDDDNHHHNHHHLLKHRDVFLVGRRVSSAHVPGNDYRVIDRRAPIFVTVVALGATAIRLQWANCHRDRACQGTQSS